MIERSVTHSVKDVLPSHLSIYIEIIIYTIILIDPYSVHVLRRASSEHRPAGKQPCEVKLYVACR